MPPISAKAGKYKITKAANIVYNETRAALTKRGDLDEWNIEKQAILARLRARDEMEKEVAMVMKEENDDDEGRVYLADEDEAVGQRERNHQDDIARHQGLEEEGMRIGFDQGASMQYHGQNLVAYQGDGFANQNDNAVFDNLAHLQNYQPFPQYPLGVGVNILPVFQSHPPILQQPPQTGPGAGIYLHGHFYAYDGLSPEQVQILNTLPYQHRAYIVQIANGIFDPTDLRELDDFPQLQDPGASMKTENDIAFKANIESIIKMFGNTSEIWSRCFLNYSSYLICFSSNSRDSKLLRALLAFHNQIIELAKNYPWDLVVVMAFYWTGSMTAESKHKPESWCIPQHVVDRMCKVPAMSREEVWGGQQVVEGGRIMKEDHMKTPGVGRKNGGGAKPAGVGKKKWDRKSQICYKFNYGSCNGCFRRHSCAKCGSGGHAAKQCLVK